MRTRGVVAAVVALSLLAGACGRDASPSVRDSTSTLPPSTNPVPVPSTAPFQEGELIRLDLPRSDAEVSPDAVASVAYGDAQLGLDILALVASDDNVMLSPYSIATALSTLYPGARGQTADEIASVLHLGVDDETLHEVRSFIETSLAATPPPQGLDDTREPFAINPANSAWGQGGYPFSQEYLATLATYYGAGLRVADFANDPQGATDTINGWVEDETEDRIRNLIPPGTIDTFTRLVLVNAIWFKANWAEQFDPDQTMPGSFTLLDGSTTSTELMHATRRTGYAETERYQALRLPYAGDAAMVVLLPRQATPAELAADLEAAARDITWSEAMVDITLPSFEFESEIPLKQALVSLGMEAAFRPPSASDGADLTGITEARELFVADALHKSFIALDEQGTEAAAATAIIVGLTAAAPPATFTADRPFLFWIEHIPTGEMLFLGQVTNPAD